MTDKLFKSPLSRQLLALLCLVFLVSCNAAPPVDELDEPLLSEFSRDTLNIQRADGKAIDFAVYLAQTEEQMHQGLMFVRKLAPNTGMLFTYTEQRIGSMWMKNTFVSLDILFIDDEGIITDIHQHTTPKSLKPLRSAKKVKGALELVAGSVDKLDIKVGDRVVHSHFRWSGTP